MRKSRYTEDQMVRILPEADTEPVSKVAKRYGISEQTIYSWRKRYGELEVADVRRLRELEAENARLKKMLAERDLEIDVMKEVSKKSGERSTAPGDLRDDTRIIATSRLPFAIDGALSVDVHLPGWSNGMRRCWKRCATSPDSIRAMPIGASRSFWLDRGL